MPVSAALLILSVFGSPNTSKSQQITVYEDAFGVPSIEASNLPDACFALGYTQGKDHALRMATNYKMARGRLAEVNGKSEILQDTLLRAAGFEKSAIESAPRLAGESKQVVDSFLAGANLALAEQKPTLPSWIEPFTETDAMALGEFVNMAFPLQDLATHISRGAGSNQFALGPSKTSTHHPILSLDPHLAWDGQDGGIIWQEFAIYTPDIHFRGFAIPGLPFGTMGHNDRVAWSMTNNDPRLYTIYSVKTNPADRTQYSDHGVWKPYTTEKVELRYLENGQLKSNTVSLKSTAWGPMIPFSNLSVRLSVPDPIASIEQASRMMRSHSCEDFREALKLRGLSMWNFVFADVEGNIGYQYNALVPHRDETVAWNKTVAGDLPNTGWEALWSLDDLPHVVNPASGILVNCNSDPHLTTLGDEINGSWPPDVTTYGPTSRWEMLSNLLKPSRRVNPEKAMEIATDCTVPYSTETVAQLARFVQVGNAIDVLKKWDHKATIDSVGCALYTYWLRENSANSALSKSAGHGGVWSETEGAAAMESLGSAAKKMIDEQGTLETRWGGIQYMQRGTVKLPVQGFGYVTPGSDIAAVSPASAGAGTLKSGRSHAFFGSSLRMIVSLEPKGVQSWSVLPYGNSETPTSAHYTDQMALYAVGKYKPTHFGLANAKRNSTRNYLLTQ